LAGECLVFIEKTARFIISIVKAKNPTYPSFGIRQKNGASIFIESRSSATEHWRACLNEAKRAPPCLAQSAQPKSSEITGRHDRDEQRKLPGWEIASAI